jgi:uncharacterized protein (TIGR00255 family)
MATMYLNSMTGFGSAQSDLGIAAKLPDWEGTRLNLDIRSVNSRFLDIHLRIPDEWRSLETGLRESINKHVNRGKVEVRAGFNPASGGNPSHSASHWQQLQAQEKLALSFFPEARRLSVADVLRLSDRPAPEAGLIAAPLQTLCLQALEGLKASRRQEGQQLGEALQTRIHTLRELAQQALPLVPQWVEAQKERFLQKWQEAMSLVGSSVSADAARDRALTEATALALRADVSEELTRLAAHLDAIEGIIQAKTSSQGVGKRLDFLIQELHREANTLGSKSSTLALTQIAVDMKVWIEQMREQVQNIE